MPSSNLHEMIKQEATQMQLSKPSCSLGFSYQGSDFHKVPEKQSGTYLGYSSFDVSSASQPVLFALVSATKDKWKGVLLVGDSSTQWEPRAVTASVCLRYGLFVVLPSTISFIITHVKYGSGKNV